MMDTPKNTQTIYIGSGRRMSSALKERLKKLGRYHGSPSTQLATPTSTQRSYNDICSPDDLNTISCKKDESGAQLQFETPTSESAVKRIGLGITSNKEIPPKRLCITSPAVVHKENLDHDSSNNSTITVSNDFEKQRPVVALEIGQDNLLTLQALLRKTQSEVKAKEEKLRKLKMVKMYRSKDKSRPLDSLIIKWRSVCQEALQDLVEKSPEPRPSIEDLLKHMQIEPQLVRYDVDNESFY